jgi:hypothetical protein
MRAEPRNEILGFWYNLLSRVLILNTAFEAHREGIMAKKAKKAKKAAKKKTAKKKK